MSVHKRNGRWQVKWREAERQRSRTFTRKGDADTFDREVARRRELGPQPRTHPPSHHIGRVRPRPLVGPRAPSPPASRAKYAWALERHLTEPAHQPLAALDVPRLAGHQRRPIDRGATTGHRPRSIDVSRRHPPNRGRARPATCQPGPRTAEGSRRTRPRRFGRSHPCSWNGSCGRSKAATGR